MECRSADMNGKGRVRSGNRKAPARSCESEGFFTDVAIMRRTAFMNGGFAFNYSLISIRFYRNCWRPFGFPGEWDK
jgi:hypothetical protein